MTATEEDFIGDLAVDDHFLWEAFSFVRLHSPEFTDIQILAAGRELLADWSARGWLAVTDSASASISIEELLRVIDQRGVASLYPERGSDIELAPTPKVFQDVPWLRSPDGCA